LGSFRNFDLFSQGHRDAKARKWVCFRKQSQTVFAFIIDWQRVVFFDLALFGNFWSFDTRAEALYFHGSAGKAASQPPHSTTPAFVSLPPTPRLRRTSRRGKQAPPFAKASIVAKAMVDESEGRASLKYDFLIVIWASYHDLR
jgi:hypothetical protein